MEISSLKSLSDNYAGINVQTERGVRALVWHMNTSFVPSLRDFDQNFCSKLRYF